MTIDPDHLRERLRQADLVVPDEDLPAIARALEAHERRIAPLLEHEELSSQEPVLRFDARW